MASRSWRSATNFVEGNDIGTNAAGAASLGNGNDGVLITTFGAQDNTIGGTTPGAGNIISGNRANGVSIAQSGASNVVEGKLHRHQRRRHRIIGQRQRTASWSRMALTTRSAVRLPERATSSRAIPPMA